MVRIITCLGLALVLYNPTIYAQEYYAEDKHVLEVFKSFFESIKAKDTLALKATIHHPYSGSRLFFQTFTGNDNRLGGGGSSTLKGFMMSAQAKGSLYGKCRYAFENTTTRIYHRYATLSTNYLCYNEKDSLEHSGRYTLHFLKSDRWRIEKVIRYIKKP